MPSEFTGTCYFITENGTCDDDSENGDNAVSAPETIDDLHSWYDASAIEDVADGAQFTTLEDQSSNGRDATANEAGSTPTYHAPIVGEPARVHFGEVPLFNLPAAIGNANFTGFFVKKADEPDPINSILTVSSANGVHIAAWLTLQERGLVKFQQGTSPGSISTFTGVRQMSPRSFHVIAVRRSGNDVTLKVDGVSEGTNTLSNSPDTTDNELPVLCNTPGGSGHGVLLAEAILYSRALTDLEIQKVEKYLFNKYAAHLAIGSLNEMTGGIQAPGVSTYVDQRTIVDAIASERAFPTTLPDCLSWLDASRVPDVGQWEDGDSVDEWVSMVGAPGVEVNGNQTESINQPTINNPGWGGKPVMSFASDNARMFTNSGLELVSDMTVFAVVRCRTAAGEGSAFGAVIAGATKDDAGTNIPWLLAFRDDMKIRWAQANGGSYVNMASTHAFSTDKAHIISARRGITSGQFGKWVNLRVNGAVEIDSAPGVDPTTTAGVAGWIGNANPDSDDFGYPLQGEIGELIFYNRYLTDDETFAVEEYLRRKWGTDIAIGNMNDLNNGAATLVAEVNLKADA